MITQDDYVTIPNMEFTLDSLIIYEVLITGLTLSMVIYHFYTNVYDIKFKELKQA